MLRKTRLPAAAVLAMMSTVLLMGCAHKGAGVASTANQPLTIDTPLNVIAADPQGKAILYDDVPGLMNSPNYPLIADMSLASIANVSNGRIPQDKLNQVQADLNQLAAEKAAAAKQQAEKEAAAKEAAAKEAAAKQTAAKQAAAKPAAAPPAAQPDQ